mgnify:CR=1 FL=1
MFKFKMGLSDQEDNDQQQTKMINYYYNLFLKTSVVCLLFYLISMKSVSAYIRYYLPKGLDKLIIKTILFGLSYFIISYLTNI